MEERTITMPESIFEKFSQVIQSAIMLLGDEEGAEDIPEGLELDPANEKHMEDYQISTTIAGLEEMAKVFNKV